MKVLIAFEFSGEVRDAFAALGHDAWSCDLLPCERGGQHLQCDVREALTRQWDFVGFHPECTYITNSGVRWLHDDPTRWLRCYEACRMFRICLDDPRPGIAQAFASQWGGRAFEAAA